MYTSSPAVAATVYLPAVPRDGAGGVGDGAEEDYGENIHFRSLANGETRRNSSGVGAQAEQWQRSRSTSSHLQIIYSLVWVDGPALPAYMYAIGAAQSQPLYYLGTSPAIPCLVYSCDMCVPYRPGMKE